MRAWSDCFYLSMASLSALSARRIHPATAKTCHRRAAQPTDHLQKSQNLAVSRDVAHLLKADHSWVLDANPRRWCSSAWQILSSLISSLVTSWVSASNPSDALTFQKSESVTDEEVAKYMEKIENPWPKIRRRDCVKESTKAVTYRLFFKS